MARDSIIFWFNAYPITKVLSFSTFVERISGLGEDLVLFFSLHFPQHRPRQTGSLEHQPCPSSTELPLTWINKNWLLSKKINHYPELPNESICPEGTGVHHLEGKTNSNSHSLAKVDPDRNRPNGSSLPKNNSPHSNSTCSIPEIVPSNV